MNVKPFPARIKPLPRDAGKSFWLRKFNGYHYRIPLTFEQLWIGLPLSSMKAKFIVCLALVLSGGLFGCSNPTQQPALTVVAQQPDSPAFVYLVGEFKNPGRIAWTNGMTLKDVLANRAFDDYARPIIIVKHTDGSKVQYRWQAGKPITNNPVLKPGDTVISPEVFF